MQYSRFPSPDNQTINVHETSDQCTQTQYKEELQASHLHLKKNKNFWEF